jgi:heptosyltransferase I
MTKNSRKALLVRVDRMGDLVLTLSSDGLARSLGFETRWGIPVGLEPVLRAGDLGDRFFTIPKSFSTANFFALLREVRALAPDVSIIFHAPAWVAFALLLARVPTRAGVLSQWWSFVLYNRGLRQKRSQSLKHESDYNADLVIHALAAKAQADATVSLAKPLKLQPAQTAPITQNGSGYVVIHPGMGGSAQNWPLASYEKLIRAVLDDARHDVFITGTLGDRPWTGPLREALAQGLSASEQARLHWRDQGQSLDDLMSLLAGAAWVVAPSTGVVHLAASLGVPTVGLYSPVRVQAPVRWGPRGARAEALAPQVSCPGHHACLMKECPLYDCMNQITVEQVLSKTRELAK